MGVFVVHALQRSTECSESPFTYYEMPSQISNSYLIQRFDKFVFTYAGQKKNLHLLKPKVYFLVLRSLSLNSNEPVLVRGFTHEFLQFHYHPTYTYVPQMLFFLEVYSLKLYILFSYIHKIFTCVPV